MSEDGIPMHPTRLRARDWYRYGAGWVATFSGIPGFDPKSLLGKRVEIDGASCSVRGVETFALPDVTGKPFGLLVRERPQSPTVDP